jgi:hypothetical protein
MEDEDDDGGGWRMVLCAGFALKACTGEYARVRGTKL